MRTYTQNPAWRSLATLSRHGRWWQMDNRLSKEGEQTSRTYFVGIGVFYQTIHAAGMKERAKGKKRAKNLSPPILTPLYGNRVGVTITHFVLSPCNCDASIFTT
jgi:hypothetical protein